MTVTNGTPACTSRRAMSRLVPLIVLPQRSRIESGSDAMSNAPIVPLDERSANAFSCCRAKFFACAS